jgi:uncharacterized membrane protein YbhN (UPF0104 family)
MPKSLLILIVKLAVTGGLIYWVLRGVDLDSLAARLGDISPLWLIGAAGLILLQSAIIVTWRWERVVATIDAPPPPWRLLRIVTISLFFNQVLPSTIGGDGMRVWLLHRRERTLGRAFRSVLIDRLLGFFGLLLLTLAGALFLLTRLDEPPVTVWVMLPLSLGGLAAIAGSPILVRLCRWLPIEAVQSRFRTIADEIEAFARDKGRLASLVGISILGQFALSGAVLLLALGFGIGLDPLGVLAVVPAIMLASSIPVSIAGWGVREATMVVGLGLLGVVQGDAALISITFGGLLLVVGLFGGLVWLLSGRQKPTADQLDDTAESSAAGRPEPRPF